MHRRLVKKNLYSQQVYKMVHVFRSYYPQRQNITPYLFGEKLLEISPVSFDVKADHFSQLGDEKQLVRLYQQQNWADFVKCAIELKKNIVISGGTSSGKTTFLNACLRHIPLSERIILLEDAREIDIPHPNQVSLLSSKGDQALAKVSMQDLVQCCLRLRPDRIIVGEVRGREILDFLSASSTGHEGSFTSIHANNPRIAFMRMT